VSRCDRAQAIAFTGPSRLDALRRRSVTTRIKWHLFRDGSPGSPPRASGMTDLGSLGI
jgi:hypothetical protein